MNRTLVVATAVLVLATTACSDGEPADPQADGASSPESSSTPAASSSASSPPPLPRSGDTVTDFNGPPDIGVSFTVPEGVEDVPDIGKRIYELKNGQGSIMIGELKHVYDSDRDGLIVPRRIGNDVAAVLDVLRSRDDVDIVEQGTVPVAGKLARTVTLQLAEGRDPYNVWAYTHDTSGYKVPAGLTSQAVLVPWRKSMIWIAVEWEDSDTPPAALIKARDELLRSLELS